jgi:hypothetical protein
MNCLRNKEEIIRMFHLVCRMSRSGRRLWLPMVFAGAVALAGCKSHDQATTEQNAAAAKRQHDARQGADVTQGGAPQGMPENQETIYSRNKVKSGSNDFDQDTTQETAQVHEGGDPDIYKPPVHKAQAHEKVVKTSNASTPTPTPNRPIDRPLDPTGKPIISETPGG